MAYFFDIHGYKNLAFSSSHFLTHLYTFLSICLRWAKWISVHCILSFSYLLIQLFTVHFIVNTMTNISQSCSCIFSVGRTVCTVWCLGFEINFLWCLFWYMLWIAVCTLAWNRFKWSWVLTNLCLFNIIAPHWGADHSGLQFWEGEFCCSGQVNNWLPRGKGRVPAGAALCGSKRLMRF